MFTPIGAGSSHRSSSTATALNKLTDEIPDNNPTLDQIVGRIAEITEVSKEDIRTQLIAAMTRSEMSYKTFGEKQTAGLVSNLNKLGITATQLEIALAQFFPEIKIELKFDSCEP